MTIELFQYITELNYTHLEYTGVDEQYPNSKNAFMFKTYLSGEKLDILKRMIFDQFNLRYHDKDSRFFHPQSFMRIVNSVYHNSTHGEAMRPLFDWKGNRNFAEDELAGSNNHPFTVEIDIKKSDDEPVIIYLVWRQLDNVIDEIQIPTQINPTGISWDQMQSKFVDHIDAEIFNGHTSMYLASLIISIKEDFQERENEANLFNAEQQYENDQIEAIRRMIARIYNRVY